MMNGEEFYKYVIEKRNAKLNSRRRIRGAVMKASVPVFGMFIIAGAVGLSQLKTPDAMSESTPSAPAPADDSGDGSSVGDTQPDSTARTSSALTASSPKPAQTETAKPTQSETPKPTQTETPTPTQTETPKPTQSETPKPTQTETPKPTQSETPKPTQTETPTPTQTETPESDPSDDISWEPCDSWDFSSYDELYSALTDKDCDSYRMIRAGNGELKRYRATLEAFENGDIYLAVPQINGKDAELCGDDKDITLYEYQGNFTTVHCQLEVCTYIEIHYPVGIDKDKLDAAKTYKEVHCILYPGLALDDREGYVEIIRENCDGYYTETEYRHVEYRDFTFADGEMVNVRLYSDYYVETPENVYYIARFYYKGVVISLLSHDKQFDDEFFSSFGIREY